MSNLEPVDLSRLVNLTTIGGIPAFYSKMEMIGWEVAMIAGTRTGYIRVHGGEDGALKLRLPVNDHPIVEIIYRAYRGGIDVTPERLWSLLKHNFSNYFIAPCNPRRVMEKYPELRGRILGDWEGDTLEVPLMAQKTVPHGVYVWAESNLLTERNLPGSHPFMRGLQELGAELLHVDKSEIGVVDLYQELRK